ncbi:MXAN_6230/SCO0854 family RING domain-containing protein [Thermocatellispora tengchongensis]|uniref:MXAN_6230/SCO0854 family RING domain-containing protein n=1 Tax=Thermocatellispora tengchongensis TaxID=1073253 RepID=UPI00363092F8
MAPRGHPGPRDPRRRPRRRAAARPGRVRRTARPARGHRDRRAARPVRGDGRRPRPAYAPAAPHHAPRPLRRTLLAALDRLSLPLLVEDLERHRAAWVHMAEVLHPHEHHRRFPTAALAFAALRGTPLGTGTPFARAMLDHAAGHPGVLAFDGVRLRPVTFARRIESALRAGDLPAALALLRTRPGELARRLAHLARLADGPDAAAALAAAVTEAAPRVSPAVLVAALGRLRTAPGGARLFFPRGGAAKAMSVLDERPPIPAATVAAVSGAIEAEMLRRAAALPPLRLALLDEGLTDLLAPAAERSASAALVRIPRGSVQPIPGGERIRLFLHWADSPDERVDLDLSVAVFDERWRFVGLCDYTNLTLGPRAAVHSGDLTSAPEPLGSSEFVDLDVRAVRRLGGRYVLPTVLSYNDVPFERLARGFAGFMETPPGQFGEDGGDGEAFDARAVRQRFDLAGPAKVLLPLVADLWSRTMRWTDVNLGVSGEIHDIDRHARSLARLASAMEDVYGLGDHVTLWELARWHAAARAEEVLIRHRDGTTTLHRRTPGEPPAAFAARLTPLPSPAPAPTGDTPLPDFAALVTADVPLAPGAQVYALYPALLDPTTTTLLDAADLLTPLTPATQLTPA